MVTHPSEPVVCPASGSDPLSMFWSPGGRDPFVHVLLEYVERHTTGAEHHVVEFAD